MTNKVLSNIKSSMEDVNELDGYEELECGHTYLCAA